MKDNSGRKLSRQQQSRPRWPGPFDENEIIIAGFKILEYLGYFRYPSKKGFHQYKVQCTICGAIHKRQQGALSSGAAKGTRGCLDCARQRYNEDRQNAAVNAARQVNKALKEWLNVMFTIPVASLEYRKTFDSEILRFYSFDD